MAKKTHIVIHCSATPASRKVSVAEINGWHKAQNFEPCKGVDGKVYHFGYHYFVHQDGTIERIRPIEARGQHCPQGNMNNVGVAICYAGGVDNNNKPYDSRTQAQKEAIRKCVQEIRAKLGWLPVIGHRDVKGVKKACPCFDASMESYG